MQGARIATFFLTTTAAAAAANSSSSRHHAGKGEENFAWNFLAATAAGRCYWNKWARRHYK